MLQTIREYTQGWIASVVVTLIILSFALWGIHSYFLDGAVNSKVAAVNGVDISKNQFALVYDRLRRQMQSQANTLANTDHRDAALKQKAMQMLVSTEVMKQSAVRDGFAIFDAQIDNYIQNMPEFQINGQFSLEKFQNVLAASMLSTSEFLELIRTNLLLDQPRVGTTQTSFSLPSETNQMLSLVNQERAFDYMIIPLQHFVGVAPRIAPQKIKAYYDAHQKEFMTPEQVSIDYVELSLNDLMQTIHPTDAVLQSFYKDNANAYMQPMKWEYAVVSLPKPSSTMPAAIEKLQNALQKSNDLSQTAKQFNATLTFKSTNLNDTPKDLQKTLINLKQAGEVSKPIVQEKNISFIKLLAVTEPTASSYHDVADKVKETYIKQQAEEKFANLKEKLASVAYEHPESLEQAAKAVNLPVRTSERFTKDQAGQNIAKHTKVRQLAFSNEVLLTENNSDVLQVNPETAVVLRLKSHQVAKLLPLSGKISQQIEKTLQRQQADQAIGQFAQTILKKLQAGESAAKIASDNKLLWTSLGMTGRYSTKVDSAILDLLFRLPKPDKTHTVNYGSIQIPGGYAIVGVKAVQAGQIKDAKQAKIFSEQYQTSEGMLEYQLYSESQMKTAKITGL